MANECETSIVFYSEHKALIKDSVPVVINKRRIGSEGNLLRKYLS